MINLNAKAKWVEFNHPTHGHVGKWYLWGKLSVCVANEEGHWHISIAHPHRYPTWDEIYTAWYDLVPNAENIYGSIILPRKSQYVNLHPNCFHVWQLKDPELPAGLIL